MRSPIIMYGIDNIESNIYDEFISVLDIAPTLYSLTESDSEISVTGESIVPFLRKIRVILMTKTMFLLLNIVEVQF